MEGDFIAIDPGNSKCGYAIFSGGSPVAQGITAPEEIGSILAGYAVRELVVGDRTGAEKLLERLLLSGILRGLRIWLVDENLSSVEGRRRFLLENRRGWRRFWPVGLQSPWRPYDDFVAVILGERYLSRDFQRRVWRGIAGPDGE